jgi:hypothetical protein
LLSHVEPNFSALAQMTRQMDGIHRRQPGVPVRGTFVWLAKERFIEHRCVLYSVFRHY